MIGLRYWLRSSSSICYGHLILKRSQRNSSPVHHSTKIKSVLETHFPRCGWVSVLPCCLIVCLSCSHTCGCVGDVWGLCWLWHSIIMCVTVIVPGGQSGLVLFYTLVHSKKADKSQQLLRERVDNDWGAKGESHFRPIKLKFLALSFPFVLFHLFQGDIYGDTSSIVLLKGKNESHFFSNTKFYLSV